MRKSRKLFVFLILTLFIFGLAVLVLSLSSKSGTVQAQTPVSFSFGVAGDYANGSNFHATAAQVKAQNPDFQLAVGDLAYSTVEQSWCNYWKNTALYNNILILAGNHDSGESSSGNINTYAQYCPYTLSSLLTGTYAKQYYFDYPQTNPIARFIMISPGLGGSYIGFDTNYAVGHQGYTFTQSAIDDARAKGIKWIVVGMHKNCLSIGTKGCEIGTDLMNLLISKRVDLVLQGHDHNYQRSKQLTCAQTNSYNASCVADDGADGQYTKGAGTIFLIDGTGGQGLYSVNPGNPGDCINTGDSETCYFAKWMGSNINPTFGFTKFSVTDTQISAQFIRSAGGTFGDSFTISSNPGSTPSPTPSPSSYPDLVVTDFTWIPAVPAVGNNVSFTATIKNQGNGATPAGTIHGIGFFIDGALSANTWSDNYTSSIPPGASVTLTSNGPPWLATAGTHNIVARVDDANRIIESNETNNTLTKTLTVNSAISSPSPSPISSPLPVCTPVSTSLGVVETTMDVTEQGTYKVWSRISAPDSAANSYLVQIDNNCPIVVGDNSGMPSNNWTWIDYKEGSDANKITVSLTSGSHSLKLIGREPGVKLDRVILSIDINCTPQDKGDNCLAASPSPSPTSPPSPSPTSPPISVDTDGDSFTDSVEIYLGTDLNRACSATTNANDEPIDSWPPDFNDDRTVNIIDVLFFGDKVTKKVSDDPSLKRYDFDANGTINIIDVQYMQPYMTKTCSP